jgi:hypothetical protein
MPRAATGEIAAKSNAGKMPAWANNILALLFHV